MDQLWSGVDRGPPLAEDPELDRRIALKVVLGSSFQCRCVVVASSALALAALAFIIGNLRAARDAAAPCSGTAGEVAEV